MIFKGLFLSWWIVFVSGDTEILVNEPNSARLWYWTIIKDSQGAGWIHSSFVKPRYRVCDISDGITREPNNWLRTDFINVRNASRLDIEIHYILLNCPKEDTSQFCKTYFTLYSYNANTEQPVPDPTKEEFKREAVIKPKRLPAQGGTTTDIFRGSVVTTARGIYLAFLDQGVCITLTKVVISYRYCPEIGSTLVTFPRTVAPANDSDLTELEGKCTDVNSVNKVKLVSVCLSNGQWDITDDLMCLCNAGYELINGSVAALECKECPRGSYKSTISNIKCLQCSPNSTSNAERTACTCNDGFYNFKMFSVLEAGCKALPLAPLKAEANVVRATTVVISWQRSPSPSGLFTNAVECFRCKSGEYKNCNETCDRQVRYLPGKENITGVNVTVYGLSSSSSYLFRVYSVGELNHQDKDKNIWNYAEVFVETEVPPSIHKGPTNKTLNESSDLHLFCNATGNPPPNITWSKVTLLSVQLFFDQVLTVKNVNKTDSGVYQCRASNGIGSDAFATSVVTVRYKPEMRDGPSFIKSWINHETEVTCETEGIPAPEIFWSRNGTVTSSTTLNSCVSTLKFTPEKKDEFGILLCSAKNLLGTGRKNITVKQLVVPAPPRILRIDSGVDNMELHWEVSAVDPDSPVLNYLVQVREKDGSHQWMNCVRITLQKSGASLLCAMNELKSGTEYIVRIAARNVVGYSAFTVKQSSTKRVTEKNDEQKGLPKSSIYGITAGAICFLALTIVITAIVCAKKRRSLSQGINKEIISESSEKGNITNYDNTAMELKTEDTKIYVNWNEYNDQDYVNFNMKIDE